MVVREGDEQPPCQVSVLSASTTEVRAKSIGGEVVVKVHLDAEAGPRLPFMELRYEPEQGERQQVQLR